MAYVIIENNEVILKSNKSYHGSIEVDENVNTGMIMNEDGSFSDRVILQENIMRTLRQRRNALLSDSDWTQYRDVTLINDADWKTYRRSLRDLPASISELVKKDFSNITWPTKPTE